MKPTREEVRAVVYDLKHAVVRQAWGAGIKPHSEEFETLVIRKIIVPESNTTGRKFYSNDVDDMLYACEKLYEEIDRLHRIAMWCRKNSGVSSLAVIRVWNINRDCPDRSALSIIKRLSKKATKYMAASDLLASIDQDSQTDNLLEEEEP